MSGFAKGHHLQLIDASGFIFRAYHALPPLTRKSDGLPVGAVAGFCNMVYKFVEDGIEYFDGERVKKYESLSDLFLGWWSPYEEMTALLRAIVKRVEKQSFVTTTELLFGPSIVKSE